MSRARTCRALAVIAAMVGFTVWQGLEADHLDGHHVLAMVGAVTTTTLAVMFLRAREDGDLR